MMSNDDNNNNGYNDNISNDVNVDKILTTLID